MNNSVKSSDEISSSPTPDESVYSLDPEPATPAVVAPETQQLVSESTNSEMPTSESAPIEPYLPQSGLLPQPATSPIVLAAGKKGKRKWLLLIAIIVAILLVLGGGAIAAYSWYQNPQKVVNDALVSSVIRAKTVINDGSLKITSDEADVELTFKGQLDDSSMNQTIGMAITPRDDTYAKIGVINVAGDMVYSNDKTLYFKLNDVLPTYQKLRDALIDVQVESYRQWGYSSTSDEIASIRKTMDDMYLPIVREFDGRWVKVTAEEIGGATDSFGATDCVTEALMKVNDDDAKMKEIIDVYQNHAFINVKETLGTRDGQMGYLLDLDEAKAKDFGKAFEETSIGQDVKACDLPADEDTDGSEIMPSNTRVEIWVGQWSHDVRRIVAEGRDDDSSTDIKLDITTDFKSDVSVEIPSDAIPFKDIQAKFESAILDSSGLQGAI